MSAVQLPAELNDSTISTSQSHDVMKKRKKRKHRASGDDQPTDVSVITTTVDDMPSEETIKHKKKKRDRSSENNDSIVEPSQSDTVESKSKRHKSKSKEKPLNEAEVEIEEDQANVTTSEEKKRQKKKKRDRSSDKHESNIEPETIIEHNQNGVSENKRKRRKSQIEEEHPKENEIEHEQDQELIQESKRKRRRANQGEEIPKETEKELNGVEEGDKKINRKSNRKTVVEKPELNGVEEGDKKINRKSSRKTVADKPATSSDDRKEMAAGKKTGSAKSFVASKVTSADKNATASSADQKTDLSSVDQVDKKITNTEMSDQDQQMLLSRMLSILPESDGMSYSQRLEELDWNLIKFGDFSVKICQKQFIRIVAKTRRSRTLAELIHDARKSRVSASTSRKTQTTPTAKPLAKRTAFQLYLKKKVDTYLQKHPGSKREDAKEKYRSKWAALSDEEKLKYIRKAEDHNTKRQEEIEEKCRSDPSYKPPRRLAKLSKEEQKILEKVDGIPPKPPGTGYLLFCEVTKERLRAEMPNISNKDLTAEVGHRWSALAKGKQEHYKKKAEKKKHKYLEFLEAHPEIEAKVNADKRSKYVIKKTVKRIFDGEPVKPPTSGYMIFCKEILSTLTDMASRDRMQEASKRWAVLPEAKKAEYNEKMKAAMERYIAELDSFKEKLSPEDLQKYEEIHKRTPRKSLSDPNKEITGKQKKNSSSDDNKETVGKPKKAASKKSKKKTLPMVVKLWSKSPTPNRKHVNNNKKAEDNTHDSDNGSASDTSSEVF